MHLIINDEQDKHLLSKKLLQQVEKVLIRLAKEEKIPTDKEVGLILVDDEVIKELNRSYRGLDKPTDVLSFALSEGEEIPLPGDDPTLGDIYISVERAIEQAENFNHELERELCFLASHGLLHLVGYDHETEDQEAEMNEKIEKNLAQFNLTR